MDLNRLRISDLGSRISTSHRRRTDIAKSTSGNAKSAVLILHDIFGFTFPNARLIADSLASAGFDVYLPDLFAGSVVEPEAADAVSGKFEGIGTSIRRGVKLLLALPKVVSILAFRQSSCPGDVDACLSKLKSRYQKVGVVGYCFGGRQAILLSQRPSGTQCDAYAVAHPGGVIAVPGDLEFPAPVLYILAEKEFQAPYDHNLIQSTLESMNKNGKVAESKYYPGTTHGFATRVDESVADLKKARDEALQATVEFFKAHL